MSCPSFESLRRHVNSPILLRFSSLHNHNLNAFRAAVEVESVFGPVLSIWSEKIYEPMAIAEVELALTKGYASCLWRMDELPDRWFIYALVPDYPLGMFRGVHADLAFRLAFLGNVDHVFLSEGLSQGLSEGLSQGLSEGLSEEEEGIFVLVRRVFEDSVEYNDRIGIYGSALL